jgi:hypothetical protein
MDLEYGLGLMRRRYREAVRGAGRGRWVSQSRAIVVLLFADEVQVIHHRGCLHCVVLRGHMFPLRECRRNYSLSRTEAAKGEHMFAAILVNLAAT